MLNPRPESDEAKFSDMIPKFWDLLHLFWDADRVEKWRNTKSQNPDVGIERCFNLISLASDAHNMWNKGLFALKPLELSPDHKKLTVQFFWQVPGGYKINDKIDLLTEPASSAGMDFVDGCFLSRYENDVSKRYIQSGETFTFTTKDPQNLPLPSVELLEMQWVLQRLVGMSGAADWPILDFDDGDIADNVDGGQIYPSVLDSLKRTSEWFGTEEAASVTPETSAATPSSAAIECY
jgi:hypothetical protein